MGNSVLTTATYGSLRKRAGFGLRTNTVEYKCDLSHTCNFTFSSNHINKAQTGDIDFNNMCYLTQYIQNIIISILNQHKILLLRYFKLFYHIESLDTGVYLTLTVTSQFSYIFSAQ